MAKTTKAKTSRKRTSSKKSKKKQAKNNVGYEIKLTLLIGFVIFLFLALFTDTTSFVGAFFSDILKGLFGYLAFIFPLVLFTLIFVKMNPYFKNSRKRIITATSFLFIAAMLSSVAYNFNDKTIRLFSENGIRESYGHAKVLTGAGIIPQFCFDFLEVPLGITGVWLMIATLIMLFLIFSFDITPTKIGLLLGRSAKKTKESIDKSASAVSESWKTSIAQKTEVAENRQEQKKLIKLLNDEDFTEKTKQENYQEPVKEEIIEEVEVDLIGEAPPATKVENLIKAITIIDYSENDDDEDLIGSATVTEDDDFVVEEIEEEIEIPSKKVVKAEKITKEEAEAVEAEIEEKAKITYENYRLPSSSLLNFGKNNRSEKDNQDILNKAALLEQTLLDFKVDAKVKQVSRGPMITRFEIQPSAGVKVSKIVNLSDDIALNLAATSVRIVAPIPGKAAVGIEIPNKTTSLVTLRDVVDNAVYKEQESPIRFGLGKGISGAPIVADLATMPHLLIAGATGSGKSVCVNTIISSILLNAKPDEVKFLMIDPKVVELNVYNDIPHLILPVVTDPKKASIALTWAVEEMERRYHVFSEQMVRDIIGYNDKIVLAGEGDLMPRIVVIIDELADLMMAASKQVEDSICRLAQKARAAGIHLIVATQRPSVDVITGVIKANIPSRIAFAVSSAIDSRTIIDMSGAEKLLGKGDMLYSPAGIAKPTRVQGAFISESEVEKLVNHVKGEVGEVVQYDDISLDDVTQFGTAENNNDDDEKLSAAIQFVVRKQKASTSLLQREFRIGYNRAARMIDELEKRGIIGEARGSKPREVLMTIAELDNIEQ